MSWRTAADETIRNVLRDLPADADEPTVRKAISDAYPFGERAMHPYKIWLDCVRRHMEARFPELLRERERKEMAKRGITTRGQMQLMETT